MSADEVQGTVIEVMADALEIGQGQVDIDEDMDKLGMDELAYMVVIMELEQEMGISIPDRDVAYLETGRELVDYLQGRMRKD